MDENACEKEPVLVGQIDIRAAGRGTRMLLGDLDGDGRMEMLLKQPDGGIDDRYVPHEVQCMTVFDLEGNQLWQVGEIDPEVRGSGADMPAQIWDIDGDGQLEVVCVMGGQFCVLEGKTGKLKYAHDLPDPDAHDCIVICNLTGGKFAQDVILKNRYRKMWAMDKDFNVLWTHEGNPGHFPWPHDFDGDGKDEIMAGYDMLDHDGTKLWSCLPLDDHADCIWVGQVDGLAEPGIVIGGSVTVLYDRQGNEVWRYHDSKESQHIAMGRFKRDRHDILIAGLDRIERGRNGIDGIFILSSSGEEIWKENRTSRGWLTILETVENWDGSGQNYILAYRRRAGLLPGLYDGYGKRVITFPNDGNVMFADLLGHGRQDVIVYTDEIAWIYSSEMCDVSKSVAGHALPQSKRLSHTTLYPGGEFPEVM
jgi:hypothetical protein